MAEKSETNQMNSNHKASKIIAVICLIIIIVAGFVMLLGDDTTAPSNKTGSDQSNTGKAKLYLSPDRADVIKGQELLISVYSDSANQSADTVEAKLKYSKDYFSFVSVDGTGSDYSLAVEGKDNSGEVSIVRGTTKPLTGKSLVAIVKLQAKNKSGKAEISFAKDSKLLDSEKASNILGQNDKGIYTIK